MNGRSSFGRHRLHANGFAHLFLFTRDKHICHSPKFVATYMASGPINASEKRTPQTKVLLEDIQLNRKTSVCEVTKVELDVVIHLTG